MIPGKTGTERRRTSATAPVRGKPTGGLGGLDQALEEDP